MVLPRLFVCPALKTKNFKVGECELDRFDCEHSLIYIYFDFNRLRNESGYCVRGQLRRY